MVSSTPNRLPDPLSAATSLRVATDAAGRWVVWERASEDLWLEVDCFNCRAEAERRVLELNDATQRRTTAGSLADTGF
ncbi:MAG: hypothetical protein AAFQ71_00145 [Planctomycetota bacterium]